MTNDVRHSCDCCSHFDFCQNRVCVFQRFFASDIKPFSLDLKRVYRFARVEPLHKTAWLIRIIACSQIRRQKRENRRRIIVNSDCSQGSLGFLRLFLETGDDSIRINALAHSTKFASDSVNRLSPATINKLL